MQLGIMEDIPPHMLNQFRLFMQMQQSYEPPANTSSAPHSPGPGNSTNTAAAPTLQTSSQNGALGSIASSQPTTSSSASRNPPITTYQSVRQPSSALSSQNRLFQSAPISGAGAGSLYYSASSGLPANIPTPPQGMGPVTGLGTSFLGFQQRTGQANQARLAAAAQHLPRRLPLQNRRHHLSALSAPSLSQPSLTQPRPNRRTRGPSGQRPHAHRQHPELSDIIYSPSGQGEPTHCHIRVKVLPDCGVCFRSIAIDCPSVENLQFDRISLKDTFSTDFIATLSTLYLILTVSYSI